MLCGLRSFADLPAEIARLLAAGERVVVVLLDAFGRRFLDRYDHPLLRRLLSDGTVTELATQFPSTTAAHVTTMHTDLPVWRHGLYEWNVLEPRVDAVITPLRFCFAGEREADTLFDAGLSPRDLLPDEPTFYERLAADGVPSFVFQPASFSPSTFDSVATRGASLRPYSSLAAAVSEAIDAVVSVEGPAAYAYVYFDQVDLAGHLSGPSSPEFDRAVLAALDAVAAGLHPVPGVRLLLTADHGQVDVDPADTLWLDELWPALADHLTHRPAGSARDVFLHVSDPPAVVAGLAATLGDHATVRLVSDLLSEGLFGPDPSPALVARLGDVCVLPEPDRMAWLRSATDVQQHFRGHHGGLTPHETATYVASLALDP